MPAPSPVVLHQIRLFATREAARVGTLLYSTLYRFPMTNEQHVRTSARPILSNVQSCPPNPTPTKEDLAWTFYVNFVLDSETHRMIEKQFSTRATGTSRIGVKYRVVVKH